MKNLKNFLVVLGLFVLSAACSHSENQATPIEEKTSANELPIAHKARQGSSLAIVRNSHGKIILRRNSLDIKSEMPTLEVAEWAINRGIRIADSAIQATSPYDVEVSKEAEAYAKLGYDQVILLQKDTYQIFYYDNSDYVAGDDDFAKNCFFTGADNDNGGPIFNAKTGRFGEPAGCSNEGYASFTTRH